MSSYSRRFFLQLLASSSLSIGLISLLRDRTIATTSTQSAARFPQGVFSGDPTAQSVVLSTRYLPPDAIDTVPLTLQVASNEEFTTLLQEIPVTVQATAGDNYRTTPGDYIARSVATDLPANQTLFYRFVDAAGATSPIGHCQTLPSAEDTRPVKLIHLSCANEPPYSIGEAMAREPDVTVVVFNGDTVYADPGWLQQQPDPSLDYYRQLYRQQHDANYTGDGFSRLFQQTAFISNWDDHEVINDYSGQVDRAVQVNSRTGEQRDVSALQAIGYQTFFEYMPVTPTFTDTPAGVNAQTRLFRQFRCGANADLFVLDLRQYRDPEGFGPYFAVLPPGLTANALTQQLQLSPEESIAFFGPPEYQSSLRQESRSLLGQAQKDWLKANLLASTAPFKFIVNEFMMTEYYALPYDRWEGYWQERQEILDFIETNNIQNVVFLTGDAHSGWINRVNGDRSPAIWEVVTGPTGHSTLAASLANAGQDPTEFYGLVNGLLAPPQAGGLPHLTTGGLRFMVLDTPNYATVEVTAAGATIQLKDASGEVITDPFGRRGELFLSASGVGATS